MEAHEYYKKETGKLYYKESALELELTDDYINWLEQNVVKLFAIPTVVGQNEQLVICNKCGGTNLYQHTKLLDKCDDCGNIQDY